MSTHALAMRQRAQSTVSLRKRMVRPTSQERGSSSELKKSSTMTSFRPKLERLIQQGKIEHLMNQDPSSKNHLLYTNHVNELDRELASTKKSLSTFVVKSKLKEQLVNQIKNNIKRVERETSIIKNQANAATQNYTSRADDLQAKKNQFQLIYWNQKMYSHLNNQGYKDEVFLKGRYQAYQRLCDVENNNKKLLQNKYHELKQLNKELRRHRRQAQNIAREQAIDKNQFIALLQQDMSQRDLMGELKADKYRKEGQINEIAPSLIEREQLQNILEVLYAHRALSQIIRVKSNNLIDKYQGVNKSYNYIKSNSNIIQPDKILKRMQQHDKLYDDALKRVNILEGQLANIETGFQNMALSKNQILNQEGHQEPIPQDYYQGRERDRYQILLSEKEKVESRNTEDEVLRLNILGWGARMFSRFGITQSESNSFVDCLTDLVVKIRQQK